jgi:5-methylcytosine-specific restriction protein B
MRPIDGLLARWLERRGIEREPAEQLDRLNQAIDDPDYAVGPSYLMTSRVAEPDHLERIWKYAILPLLEEHYYGSGRDVNAEFGLDAIRRTPAVEVDDELI